jgi:hypothetical protein
MPSRHSDRGRALSAANEKAPPSDMYNAVTAALEEGLSPEELYPAALMKFMVSPTAAAKNALAQTVGFPGDIDKISFLLSSNLPGIKENLAPQSGLPDSEEMAEMLGGNPDHPSWLPSALLAPGPGEILAGAKVAGKALLAGMKEVAPGAAFAQALFHGTPHKFDMFDLKAIGTGEGAQAYGHGLYFAESPGVAKSYQKDLTRDTVTFPEASPELNSVISREFRDADFPVLDEFDSAKDIPDEWWGYLAESIEEGGDPVVANELRRIDKSTIQVSKGHLYEAIIPDETIEKMLDWDAPLSEQPEALRVVKETIGDDLTFDIDIDYGDIEYTSDFPVERLTGAEAYRQLATRLDSSEAASSALSQAGIPGIRYYDNQSRFGGVGNFLGTSKVDGGYVSKIDVKGKQTTSPTFKTEGEALQWTQDQFQGSRTRNIVVFNPDDITSVKRDGELVYEAAKPTTSGVGKVEWQDTTDIPNFEDAKKKPEYFRDKKNTVVTEVMMSPDEYLQYVDEGFVRTGEAGVDYGDPIQRELVERYSKEMQSGDRFPRVYLDYKDGFSQEGRHRALAAKDAGAEMIPVDVRYAADAVPPHAVRANPKPTTSGPK